MAKSTRNSQPDRFRRPTWHDQAICRNTVLIPRWVRPVDPDALTRTFAKQGKAINWIRQNPFAWAMNVKWRSRFRWNKNIVTLSFTK